VIRVAYYLSHPCRGGWADGLHVLYQTVMLGRNFEWDILTSDSNFGGISYRRVIPMISSLENKTLILKITKIAH